MQLIRTDELEGAMKELEEREKRHKLSGILSKNKKKESECRKCPNELIYLFLVQIIMEQ